VKKFKNTAAPPQPYLETQREAKRLLRKIPKEFQPVAEASLLTGMRYGELRTMRVRDVNLRTNQISVLSTTSKSAKTRHIDLTDEGIDFFEAHTAGKKQGDLVLTRSNGEAWKHGDQVRPMQEANEAAEIEPAVSFHGLRRTYGSWLAMEGVPLQMIQQVLGHQSITTTEKHYAHLGSNAVRDAIRANLPTLGIKTNVHQIGRKQA
jgi:integrase